MENEIYNSFDIPEFYSIKIPSVDSYGQHGVEFNSNSLARYRSVFSGKIRRFDNDPAVAIKPESHPLVEFDNGFRSYEGNAGSGFRTVLNSGVIEFVGDSWNFESSYYSEPTIF